MEQVFLQMLAKLNGQIISQEIDFDVAHTQLDQHLQRAKANKMPRYHIETLNAFGILAWAQGDLTRQRRYYETAYAMVDILPGDNGDFKDKIENNLAHMFVAMWDLDTAVMYAERANARMRGKPTTLNTLYTHATLLNIYVNQRRFEDATQMYEETWGKLRDVQLDHKTNDHQDYMFLVSHLLHKKAHIAIAQRNCEGVLPALRLAKEQLQGVTLEQVQAESDLMHIVHTLICLGDTDTAQQALDTFETTYSNALPPALLLEIGLLCQHMGCAAFADQLAQRVLAHTSPDNAHDAPARAQAKRLQLG